MKKLKSIEDFQKEKLFVEKQELMNYKGGTEAIGISPGDFLINEELPGGGTSGSTAGAFGSAASGGGGGANTSFYKTSSKPTGPDRLYCSKQDNPMLPGYGDNGGVAQCVEV